MCKGAYKCRSWQQPAGSVGMHYNMYHLHAAGVRMVRVQWVPYIAASRVIYIGLWLMQIVLDYSANPPTLGATLVGQVTAAVLYTNRLLSNEHSKQVATATYYISLRISSKTRLEQHGSQHNGKVFTLSSKAMLGCGLHAKGYTVVQS